MNQLVPLTAEAHVPSAGRVRAAFIVALVADLLQIGLFPLFIEGALSPLDAALDVTVGATLIWLLGFHWAFVPGFIAEALPVADLVPTWTGAVLLASRARAVPRLADGK
jgi:hypothetical protein